MTPSRVGQPPRARAPAWLALGHGLLLATILGCLTAVAALGLGAWRATGPGPLTLLDRTDRRPLPAAASTAMPGGATTSPASAAITLEAGAAPPGDPVASSSARAGGAMAGAGASADADIDTDGATDRRGAVRTATASVGIVGSGLDRVQPGAGPASPPAMREDGYDPAVLEKLAAELKRRRDEVEARARSLDAKAAAMALVEERLDVQVARLEGLRKDLAGVLDEVGKDEEARLTQLVKVYEAMKAKQAAPIFDAMDIELLLRIVRRMRDAKVAAVVAEMSPEKARILTTRLAAPPVLPAIQ